MNESPPFPEPAFTPPGWQPPADSGFNARPHFLEGRYWVSFDRQHWWNGSAWIPGPPPVLPSPTSRVYAPGGVGAVAAIVGLIGLGLLAVFALGLCTSMGHSGIPGAPMP